MVKYKETPGDRPVNCRGTLLVLNIKLLHNQAPENYIKLFQDLEKEDYVVNLRGEHYIEMISFGAIDGYKMYRGTLVTYMGIRSKAWFNIKTKEIEEHTLGENLFANTKKSEFYFIPEVHRLCIFANSEIKLNQVKLFLEESCKRLLGEDQVHIIVETSQDAIKMIMEASELSKLKIFLTYTNKDFTTGFAEVLDNKVKEANVSTLNLEMNSAKGESLKMEKDGLVTAALELVPSNGSAYAVTKINVPNKKKKKRKIIKTSEYPRKISISCKLNNINNEIYSMIMSIFNLHK